MMILPVNFQFESWRNLGWVPTGTTPMKSSCPGFSKLCIKKIQKWRVGRSKSLWCDHPKCWELGRKRRVLLILWRFAKCNTKIGFWFFSNNLFFQAPSPSKTFAGFPPVRTGNVWINWWQQSTHNQREIPTETDWECPQAVHQRLIQLKVII